MKFNLYNIFDELKIDTQSQSFAEHHKFLLEDTNIENTPYIPLGLSRVFETYWIIGFNFDPRIQILYNGDLIRINIESKNKYSFKKFKELFTFLNIPETKIEKILFKII